MENKTIWICPLCGTETSEFPALSRKDNKTEICSDCGNGEALADYYGQDSEFVFVVIGGEMRRIHKDLIAELERFTQRNNDN